MRAPEGGFYSALDADSEGVEGKFYVWSLDGLRTALGDDADAAIAWFGATERGNFEGANILESRGPEPPAEQRERIRATLLDVRAQRVRPGLDDKRLAAWNALMIAALADAGAVLGRDDYLDAARAAAAFVLDRMRTPDGRLLRTFNAGTARLGAYLEDHAFLLEALLVLYQATFEERWFVEARALADTIVARFGDPERGGFFSTPDDHEALIARRKDLEDSPIPSGASSAALGLLRLAALTGEHAYEEQAQGQLALLHEVARPPPAAPSGTCCRRSTSTSRRGARSPWPATQRAWRRWPPSCARRAGRTSWSLPARARGRPRWRSWSTARPWTAAPRPTCASASPAARRSPTRTSCGRCCSADAQRLRALDAGQRAPDDLAFGIERELRARGPGARAGRWRPASAPARRRCSCARRARGRARRPARGRCRSGRDRGSAAGRGWPRRG